MKLCLICGAEVANQEPVCWNCGEASFRKLNPVDPPGSPNNEQRSERKTVPNATQQLASDKSSKKGGRR